MAGVSLVWQNTYQICIPWISAIIFGLDSGLLSVLGNELGILGLWEVETEYLRVNGKAINKKL